MDYFIGVLVVYIVNPKASLVLLVGLLLAWLYAKIVD